ncbi:MAG: hypothetical protein GXY81_02055 [Candidatus Cloacimonetes bacterium]|nr:hypothetical protein [Candidatus Cloacimonadota bacterium]
MTDKWISVGEYTELVGISWQAVMKRIKAGQLEAKEMDHPSVRVRVSFLVNHDIYDASKKTGPCVF